MRILLLFIAWLAASPALGYVREINQSGIPLAWCASTITIDLPPSGPKNIAYGLVQREIERSGANWTDPASATCGSNLQFAFVNDTALRRADPNDGRNIVAWFQDLRLSPTLSLHPEAPAITTLASRINRLDGSRANIVDADTELNDADPRYRWGIVDPQNPDTSVYDIQNTLTHEFGHTLGLGHSCYDGKSDSNPSDQFGARIPDCPASGAVRDATMYYTETPGEWTKRFPKPDELSGICDIYPRGHPPGACFPDLKGGCSLVPGGAAPRAPRLFGLLGALMLGCCLVRKRRPGVRRH